MLKFNKLVSEVLAFNEIIIKIHQRFGSKIEGTLRQHIFKNGKYHDVIVLGILKEEWEKIKDKHKYIKVDME